MDWLVVSNIALWIAFIAVSLVCLALARQIGILYERVAPAGALMVNQTIEVGTRAPELAVPTLTGDLVEVGKPESGRSQLLYFMSPDCPVCKSLLPAVTSVARAESDWLDLVFASDGSEHDHQAYVEAHRLQRWPYAVSELLGKSFGVAKLPYAVLIDEDARIAAMGIVNSREHIDSLFEAKDLNVASIQDYLQQAQQQPPELRVESVNGAISEKSK
jgi:methylamine dehydrogenase accessory protein MauD